MSPGKIPLSAELRFRVTDFTRERAELAAAELEVDLSEWCRAIIEGALEQHFEDKALRTIDVPSRTNPNVSWQLLVSPTGQVERCTCPGWKNRGRCLHADEYEAGASDPTEEEDPESLEEYEKRLEEAAAAARDQEAPRPSRIVHPGLHDPQGGDNPVDDAPGPRSPRECPHLPQWRMGSTCSAGRGGCGARIGGLQHGLRFR